MRPIGTIRYLTIHASFTPPDMDVRALDIYQWHVLERGWSDIGYHYIITRDGHIEGGRDVILQGAHVGGHNAGNLGICMAGGMAPDAKVPQNNFTDEQWIALYDLMKRLHWKYPKAVIMGHNGFPGHEARGCPCFDWREWKRQFFKRLDAAEVPFPSHWYDEVESE